MHGSARLGYGGSEKISDEYNVRADPAACRKAFSAPWEVTITPVDTCGLVVLKGEAYAQVRDCGDPVIQALIENYTAWAANVTWTGADPATQSSTLFDTVAVYLAFSESLLEMEELGIRVTDDGYTVVDEEARTIRCAMAWKDLPGFERFLVRRLTGQSS
jgi:inosine-uridine nucleoside N-ribohydrolase